MCGTSGCPRPPRQGRYLDEEYGPHPASSPADPLAPKEEREFARLDAMPIERVIGGVAEARGGARTIASKSYCLDRRLEVLAHVFRHHPRILVEARRLGLLPPEEPRRSSEDLVSYLVGCAFGRYDSPHRPRPLARAGRA